MKIITLIQTVIICSLCLSGCTHKARNVTLVPYKDLELKCQALETKDKGLFNDYEIEYFQKVYNIVQSNWHLPSKYRDGKFENVIIIQIAVDGNLQKISYESRSQNNEFDNTTIEAIKKSTPFPDIPQEFNKECLQIGLVFTSKNIKN